MSVRTKNSGYVAYYDELYEYALVYKSLIAWCVIVLDQR